MLPIMTNDCKIDDLQLQKMVAINKIENVLSFGSGALIKTASINHDTLINLFIKMLASLNLETDGKNIHETLDNLSKNTSDDNAFSKMAARNVKSERKDEIKIASKSIKDSHYQIDLSKDAISKNGKKIIMVSCYARDAYLGRYLIKRNYFYTMDREVSANEAYDELLVKTNALKDRYYNEIIDVAGISSQIKVILDGVISEIKFEEDSIGTTVSR